MRMINLRGLPTRLNLQLTRLKSTKQLRWNGRSVRLRSLRPYRRLHQRQRHRRQAPHQRRMSRLSRTKGQIQRPAHYPRFLHSCRLARLYRRLQHRSQQSRASTLRVRTVRRNLHCNHPRPRRGQAHRLRIHHCLQTSRTVQQTLLRHYRADPNSSVRRIRIEDSSSRRIFEKRYVGTSVIARAVAWGFPD